MSDFHIMVRMVIVAFVFVVASVWVVWYCDRRGEE